MFPIILRRRGGGLVCQKMGVKFHKGRREGEYCFLGGLLHSVSQSVSVWLLDRAERFRGWVHFLLPPSLPRSLLASFSIWRAPSADIFPLFSLRPLRGLPYMTSMHKGKGSIIGANMYKNSKTFVDREGGGDQKIQQVCGHHIWRPLLCFSLSLSHLVWLASKRARERRDLNFCARFTTRQT